MNRKFCVSAAGVMAIGVLAVAGCKMSSAGATEQINVEGPVNYEITCPAEKYSELLPVSDTQDIPQIIMSRDWAQRTHTCWRKLLWLKLRARIPKEKP